MTKPKKPRSTKAKVKTTSANPPTLKWRRYGPEKKREFGDKWTEYIATHGDMTFYIIFDPILDRPGWTTIERTAWVDDTDDPICHSTLDVRITVAELESEIQLQKHALLGSVMTILDDRAKLIRNFLLALTAL